MSKGRYILILSLFLSISALTQNVIPTVGTDFWMGYLTNWKITNLQEELRLFISSETATSGTVSVPLKGWTFNFNVLPNITTIVTIPNNIAENYLNDVVDTKGVHIVSNDTISLFAINFDRATADGTKVLPTNSLGTKYMVAAYTGVVADASEFLIVATADSTEIEIIPKTATIGGHAAGIPYIIRLNQGETYQVKGAFDLTGTTVRATAASGDCRPFAVFSGSVCTNMPSSCGACDHIFEQNFSYDTWGTNYYVVPFLTTTRYTYRILARDNGTVATVNGGAPINLNAGQFIEVNAETSALNVAANNPIAVVQHMEGKVCAGNGDPAMLILNADDQKIDEVTFSTVASTIIVNHMLNVIVETIDAGSLLLDGVPIPVGNYTPFPTDPTKSYAQVTIAQGSHTLNLNNGFTAYVYGTGSFESYTYSVGSFKQVNIIPVDTVLCSSDTMTLAPSQLLYSPWWSTETNPSDTIGTGLSLTLFPPIISDVYVVKGNSTISGCETEKRFSVELSTPPVITVTASEDTVCKFTEIQMNVSVLPAGGLYIARWSPAYYFDNPTSFSPVMTAQESGWVYVTISTLSGCGIAVDSVYIEVVGGGVKSVTSSSNLSFFCLPDTAQLDLKVLQILQFDDFNGGNDPIVWDSLIGHSNSNVCGAVSGDALYFDGASNRFAETNSFDLTLGGTVDFYIKVANDTAPCENADFGEDILFQYSINGGGTWITINTLFEFSYPNLTYVTIPIPVAAQTINTKFRWIQPVFTGAGEDNWILDNVSISLFDVTGLTINWQPSASLNFNNITNPLAFPIVPTTYTIVVTDTVLGCQLVDSVLVTPIKFAASAGNDTILCSSLNYVLEGSTDAVTPVILWTNGGLLNDSSILNPFLTVDTFATFILSVSKMGCVVEDTVVILNSTTQLISFSSDTTICEGDSVVLNLTSGSNYLWTPITNVLNSTTSNPIFYPITTTNYVLTYDDSVTCSRTDSIMINVIPLPTVTLMNDTTVCPPEVFDVIAITNGISNLSYLWSTSATDTFITVSALAQYWVDVSNTCATVSDTVNVSKFTVVSVNLGVDTALCDGDVLVLNPSIVPGSAITWSTGAVSNSINVTTSNTIWISVTDPNTCIANDTIEVLFNNNPIISLGVDRTICDYDSTVLDAFSPQITSYQWSTGATTSSITVLDSAQYDVLVTDINRCIFRDTVKIGETTPPSPSIIGDTVYCSDSSTVLSLGTTYNQMLWSTGSVFDSTMVSGAVTQIGVQVGDLNFCIGTDTRQIIVVNIPSFSLGPDKEICNGVPVSLDGTYTDGSNYLWSTGEFINPITVGVGIYTLTLDYRVVCKLSDTIEVRNGTTPVVDLGANRDNCVDRETVVVAVVSGTDSLVWMDGSKELTYFYEGKQQLVDSIIVSATAFGCGEDSDTIRIIFKDCNCMIFVPNAFTPNNDLINEGFSVKYACQFTDFEMLIYDRWGELIYSTNDPDFVWIGTKFPQGIYVWKMTYKYVLGEDSSEAIVKIGRVALLK